MVSSQVIRRYPFFAGIEQVNIEFLADVAEEMPVDEGYRFFNEGDKIRHFYLCQRGSVGITIEIPKRNVQHALTDMFTGDYRTEDVAVSTVGSGQIFGWSGLVPPHETMAGAKALTGCDVIAFQCGPLFKRFEVDCQFGYTMMLMTTQVIRSRLRDRRIESLEQVVPMP